MSKTDFIRVLREELGRIRRILRDTGVERGKSN